MRIVCLICLLLATAFTLLACSSRETDRAEVSAKPIALTEAGDQPQPRPLEDPLDPKPRNELERWRAAALKAVENYKSYVKVADYPQWAPTMCAAPMKSEPFMSAAEGGRAHGQKLYFLWVADGKAYSTKEEPAQEMPQPVGQIIVKETFFPVEGRGGVRANGKEYTAGEKGPLFLMMLLEPGAEGTDEGWVYATLSADGKEVTAAGRLGTCMGCHIDAGDDRVFGVKADLFKED